MTNWTPEMDTTLLALWPGFLSARAIAEQIGNGVTRNGVIGRAHRMKLGPRKLISNERPQPGVHKVLGARIKGAGKLLASAGWKPPMPAKNAPPATPAPARAIVSSPNPLDIVELPFRGACKYPITDVLPYMFCNNPCETDCSYCTQHMRVVYTTYRRAA